MGGVNATAPLLLGVVREASKSADRLKAQHLSSILHSCARWGFPLPPSELARLAEALGLECATLEPATAGKALHALSRLLPQTALVGSGHSDGALDPSCSGAV